jgi:hypothetical protein
MKNVFVKSPGVLLFALLGIAALPAQDMPLWFTRPGAVYPPDRYVVGTGVGGTAEDARTRALAQISQFFQSKVTDTTQLLSTYNDALAAAEHNEMSQSTVISSEAEFFGVEFPDVYRDKSGVYYAAAYIDREEAGKKYDARIQANVLTLTELIKRYENSPNPRLAINRLGQARILAEATAGYADMALLLNGAAGPRYTALPAIVTGIGRAIEANEGRLTATINLNDQSAASIAQRAAEILRRDGFLLADSGGVYTVSINFTANENTTRNYHTVEPVLAIAIEAQDGTPLVTYTKKYPLFRHVTREDALARALRNIEQDLAGEFAKEVGGIGK